VLEHIKNLTPEDLEDRQKMKRLRRKILVPFGVFLAVGGFVSLYFQNVILDFYFHLFQ